MVRASADDKAKLGILILPQSNGSSRIALSYAQRVPDAKVKQEIASLLQNTQGALIAPPRIQHYSLDPSQLKKFPVTTSAIFQMTQSAAGSPSYPLLKPYLTAFRAEKRLEILVEVPEEQGDSQPQEFQSPELRVTFLRSKGIHRYHAEILSASGTLPNPNFTLPVPRTQEIAAPTVNTSDKSQGSTLGKILLAVTAGIFVGCVIYFVAMRIVLPSNTPKP